MTGMNYDLPAPAHWHDAELTDGTPSMVPSWPLEVVAPSVGITAWTGGVDIDGTYHDGPALDILEQDALSVLAAVATAREFAASPGDRARDGETP